jgi:hypothetical protein
MDTRETGTHDEKRPGTEDEDSQILLPGGALPQAGEWCAAHTHARAEKALLLCLREWGVPAFLPCLRRQRIYGARRRVSFVPLFAGYLFYDRLAVERQTVLETNKVAQILVAPDPEQLRSDLTSLCLALAVDIDLKEVRFGEPGTPVLVARGPLKGTEGILIRYQGRDRLVLQVHMLGRAVCAEIDASLCEPL